MRIICDTAALLHPDKSAELDITVLPLNVTISNKTYREFVDIEPKEFIDLIKAGGVPQSSQPSVGIVMEAYEASNEEALVFAMADGLSGTYATFEGVKGSMDNADNITVINTRTLAGPETLLVEKAIRMRNEGKSKEEILEAVNYSMDSEVSFLIPQDFGFLQRGGRLSPLAAKIGGLVKIVPVLRKSDDGKILEKFAIKRTIKGAVTDIAKYFIDMGVNENYTVYLCHAGVEEQAEKMGEWIRELIPSVTVKIAELSPAFITQGGPGCVSVQAIRN